MAQHQHQQLQHGAPRAVAVPMPTFIARCLEEIALEGRCGIPLRALFALVDPTDDVTYRAYAWRVLRTMRDHVRFHHMERSPDALAAATASAIARQQQHASTTTAAASIAASPRAQPQQSSTLDDELSSPMSSPPRRKRKWSTTLMHSPHGSDDERATDQQPPPQPTTLSSTSASTKAKTKAKVLEPVVPSARRKALKKQRKLLSGTDKTCTSSSRRDPSSSSTSRQSPAVKTERRRSSDSASVTRRQTSLALDSDPLESGERVETTDVQAQAVPNAQGSASAATADRDLPATSSVSAALSPESAGWVLRSPRGFVLGIEIDASSLSYDDAMTDAVEGVLGVVACEELRLQYLGVTDPTSMDTLSPQFDLLEMIGRARVQGENAAVLANSLVFGDARKLHYLLDMLVANGLVAKNIVTADHKRFNILHLARFTSAFHPSMVSPTATMEREAFPKKLIPYVIAEMLVARGERTCVFADIGRELGYDKRYQEKLRKFFFHQMHVSREFPLELFMARCTTGASEYRGRKLWCIRLRHGLVRGSTDRSAGWFEPLEPPPPATTGPVIERGLMEQVYAAIESRSDVGATIPEIRDMLGVPTFKLPYKLAQGLISKYNLTVRQVVVGKSTMYRMFTPGGAAMRAVYEEDAPPPLESVPALSPAPPSTSSSSTAAKAVMQTASASSAEKPHASAAPATAAATSSAPQPSTMKAASRNALVSSTAERRRRYMLERIRKDKIVPTHLLRLELIALERDPALAGSDLNVIDTRSIRRIVDEFEAAKLAVSMDIALPPRRVLQKSDRVVKCVCLAGYERNRDAIAAFVDAYVAEQQQRYLQDIGPPALEDVVVMTNRSRARRKPIVHDAATEVVHYSAASYKSARLHLAKQHKQNRRLGMFFGSLYRCRALHLLLWDKLEQLRARTQVRAPVESAGAAPAAAADSVPAPPKAPKSSSSSAKDVVFALHDVLELLSVKEYVQLAGANELLSESEENRVRMAMVRGDSWPALSREIQHKVRGCEADRFSRIVHTLIELGLVQVADDSSRSLLHIFQTGDFDAMVSQVASATLSGGLLKLKDRARIALKRGHEILRQLPTKQSYVYAANFSGKSRSDHFVGRVPLEFQFHKSTEHVVEYWRALQFLSMEGAHLGSGSGDDGETLSGNVDSERIRAAPVKEHNLYALKSWVPRGTTNQGRSSAKQKAEEAVAGPMRLLKRKRFQNAVAKAPSTAARSDSREAPKAKATTKRLKVAAGVSQRTGGSEQATVDTEAGVSKFRRLAGTKQSARASKWTLDDDLKLMDAYMDELSCKWFIEIPLALQQRDERLAFRNTSLERTKISWRTLAKALGKKYTDCYLRVNELLAAPAVRARVETTKRSITEMKNPGGVFHEERAIARAPRLSALLNRALQILLHERASYYPVLADMLISPWSEREVKLVWRYLWLAGLITRTRTTQTSGEHERGFSIHSRVHEMKSLGIAHYAIDVFCEAAEYAAFVQENVREVALLESDCERADDSSASTDGDDFVFEHELEPNASAGQMAAELSATILSVSEMVPEYVAPSVRRDAATAAAASIDDSRKSVAIKGFAGHLSATCGGAAPEDFLREYWTVKSRAQILSDDAKQDAIAVRAKAMEAFSVAPALRANDDDSDDDSSHAMDELLASQVVQVLSDAGPDGLSFRDLCAAGLGARSVRAMRRVLDRLVQRGDVSDVSSFAHARFVLKAHSGIWTLHPYRIASDAATSGKVHFHFDKQQTVVARPWLLLDGSANTRVALVLKRKVVNIVMCAPGIHDHALHRKTRKLLGLQSLRTLLDELVDDGIVHARLVRHAARSPRSIFAKSKRPRTDAHVLVALGPGDTRFVDSTRDAIHYFPAVNCMELLGAAACDADVRSSESE